MLTRFRIEVEGADSAAATEAELSKYEHALQVAEAERYGIRWGDRKQHDFDLPPQREALRDAALDTHPRHLATIVRSMMAGQGEPVTHPWGHAPVDRDYFNEQLGREVTDEVIEYDPGLPGYKGRRVVHFKRIDTRHGVIDV